MLLYFIILHIFVTFSICTSMFWLFSRCVIVSQSNYSWFQILNFREAKRFSPLCEQCMKYDLKNFIYFFFNKSYQKYHVVFWFENILSNHVNDISSHFSTSWIHFIFDCSKMVFEMVTFVLTFVFFSIHRLYIVFFKSFWIFFRFFVFFVFVNPWSSGFLLAVWDLSMQDFSFDIFEIWFWCFLSLISLFVMKLHSN